MTNRPCPHLERHLPPLKTRSPMEGYSRDQITEETVIEQREYERQARRLQRLLERIGLEPFRAELLMLRFVDNLTLKEISTQWGYLSSTAVNYLIKDTLKRLKTIDSLVVSKLLKEFN